LEPQRQSAHGGHVFDAGYSGKPIADCVVDRGALRRRTGGLRHLRRDGQHVLRPETRVHRQKLLEAADEQSRAHQQEQRRRHLHHHQCRAQTMVPRGQTPAGFAQRGFDFAARHPPRRRKARQQGA